VSEENKAVVRRFNELVEQNWRTGDADAFDEVVAPDFVHHSPGLPEIYTPHSLGTAPKRCPAIGPRLWAI
jgi:hypothetical protein